MEMGNVSKRQQPDHRADNNRRPPMGLQSSQKLPQAEASFSWPLIKYVYYLSDDGRHTKPQNTQETKIKNHIRLIKARGS